MCGLLFSYDQKISEDELKNRASKALERLEHRGPDDKKLVGISGAYIGHTRLSILDVAHSLQPMPDKSGRFWLVFNGEIYNYDVLRAGLEAKWEFRTQGDTEVVLAGLVLAGSSFLEQLEGMWSIVLWDSLLHKVFISRDRFGKKPLYYLSRGPTQFSCASELPALRLLDIEKWNECLKNSADFFKYGYYLPGETAYTDARELLPGHYAEWSVGTEVFVSQYWSINVHKIHADHHESNVKLLELICDAVKKRLVSDVEVGAFLSGGVDSSLVSSLTTKFSPTRLKTFSVSFDDRTYDESRFAKLVSERIGSEHFEAAFDLMVVSDFENMLLNNFGQPFGDPSVLPTYLVSKIASQHVKVALSGDGGDEVFCGYQRYQARVILNWYSKLPISLRKFAEGAIRSLPEPMVHHSSSILKKAHLFVDAVENYGGGNVYVAPLIASNRALKLVVPELTESKLECCRYEAESGINDIEKMMLQDMLVYLPQDILQKVDRASMANSLEVRSPFLDHQLVEFAFSMPVSFHRSWGKGKRMLKSCAFDRLPEEIWSRRKQGFAVPLQKIFSGEVGRRLVDLVNSVDSPISRNGFNVIYREHLNGYRDYGLLLWNIYSYLIWKSNLNK